MKICFLDNVNISYTSEDMYSNKVRGAENILINLSREFCRLNHDVTIFNNCKINNKIDNVNWINLNSVNDKPHFDLAISNNDIKLFDVCGLGIAFRAQDLVKDLATVSLEEKDLSKIIPIINNHYNLKTSLVQS